MPMIQHNKLDDLYTKIGGVYKTTVLIQKRLRELNRGARKLVSEESKSPIATVMNEIASIAISAWFDAIASSPRRAIIQTKIMYPAW